jgi:AcrR family transcriptional regulator
MGKTTLLGKEVQVITRIIKDYEVRYAELLDAAQQLFSSVGYEKTMIIDIVKKAGVAKGTFYYYFPTKEAVLEAVLIGHATEFVREFESINSNATALHKLKLLIEHLFFPNNTHIIFNRLWDEKRFDLVHIICKKSNAVFAPLLSDIIKQGNLEGTMHVLLIDETIAILWSTIICLWESLHNDEAPEIFINKVKIVETILERILGIGEGTFSLIISLR